MFHILSPYCQENNNIKIDVTSKHSIRLLYILSKTVNHFELVTTRNYASATKKSNSSSSRT